MPNQIDPLSVQVFMESVWIKIQISKNDIPIKRVERIAYCNFT